MTFPNSVCAASSGYNGTCYRWNFLICRHLHCDHHNLDRHLSMITLATMISSVMVIIAMATSTMVIIFVQFKRVLGQGRDG